MLVIALASVLLVKQNAQAQNTATAREPEAGAADESASTSVGGYGEINYVDPEGSPKGVLDVTRFIVFLEHSFSDDISLFSELEVEHTKVEGDHGELALEQAYLQYSLSERANIRAGLMVLPTGIINEYHEPPTFNGVQRPHFDHDVIPTTWREIGMGVVGRLPEVEGLQYRAYITSGLNAEGFSGAEGIREGRLEGAEASMSSLAISGRLEYLHDGLRVGGWLYYGGSAFGNDAIGEGLLGAPVTMYGADAQANFGDLYLRGVIAGAGIADAQKINDAYHRDSTGAYEDPVASAIGGGYFEVAYNVAKLISPGTSRQLLPFVRFEKYNTNASMPGSIAANKQNDRTYIVAGLTFKPTYNTAFKLDWTAADDATDEKIPGQFALGVGYNF